MEPKMKTVGIIAEYNPFHNGHLYHIRESRRLTGAGYVVVVMSGDFVQRGGPALADKYTRTRMALCGGADLVLELPACFSCASAEYFAGGALALLDGLGVIDFLSFGSECGDASALMECASILLKEPPVYRAALRKAQKEGMTFPAARKEALSACLSSESSLSSKILDSPNNILGAEYCRALLANNSRIQPVTIPRKGSGYHNLQLPSGAGDTAAFASASAVRNALAVSDVFPDNLSSQLPDCSLSLLRKLYSAGRLVSEEDFSQIIHYRLLQASSPDDLMPFLDMTPDLARRIMNLLPEYTGYAEFLSLLKTKQVTLTRVRRCLLHLLLDIRTSDIRRDGLTFEVPYARILGFKKSASPLLREIKTSGNLPLITKVADAASQLHGHGLQMLQKDIRASEIYHCICQAKSTGHIYNEYRISPVIV